MLQIQHIEIFVYLELMSICLLEESKLLQATHKFSLSFKSGAYILGGLCAGNGIVFQKSSHSHEVLWEALETFPSALQLFRVLRKEYPRLVTKEDFEIRQ